MKISLSKKLSSFIVTMLFIPSTADIVQAQQKSENTLISQRAIKQQIEFKGEAPPSISKAGTINAAEDHYFDINVKGEPLNRLRVLCVTFHELDNVKVIDQASGQEIPHTVNYGFEEFTVTFDRSLPLGQKVRVIIEGATVRGKNTGEIIPYRIFAESDAFGEIPLGTALVRTIDEN